MLKKHLIALVMSLAFFAIFAVMSLRLYEAHQTRGDLTAYAQGMWNTLHGHFMASTYNYSVHNYYDREFREITADNSNIMGIHFNPILLTFIPVYAIFQSPETLLVLQAFLVAFGGLIIYVLAGMVLKNKLLALCIQFAYLTYFATVSAVLSQFHAYTLALFFGPLLLLCSQVKQSWIYYLSLILFLLVQENTSLVATFFGLYLALSPSSRRRGVFTILISSLYFICAIYYTIPALSPYHFYLFSGIYGTKLGGSIGQIMLNSMLHPRMLLETIFTEVNLTYIGNLLIGISPFAFFAPLMALVGFSSLAQNIISTSLGLKTQQMHYESGSVAFLFYALILGMSVFLTKTKYGKSRYGIVTCMAVLIVTTGISYKQFTSPRLNPHLLTISLYTWRDAEMDNLISKIPTNASVSTQDYLSAQLSSRSDLYQFPVYADRVDYLLLAKRDAVWPLSEAEQQEWLRQIRTNQKYIVDHETGNFILFRRVR